METGLEDILKRILGISIAQQNLIRDANAEALERNLERRQACLDELEQLGNTQGIVHSEEAKRLLAEIQKTEEKNFSLMETEMASFRDKMRKNNEARTLTAHYQPFYAEVNGGIYNKKQ